MCLDEVSRRCAETICVCWSFVRSKRDPDAWEHLYRRSYNNLYGFARRRLFDDHAADDVVSETMTRALDNIDRFTWRGGGFDAWLYGIARNVVFEVVRRRARMAASIDSERATTERGPEEHAIANDDAAAVRLAFDPSAAEERELLELRVQGALTSEEVGQLLGKQAGRSHGPRAGPRTLRTILKRPIVPNDDELVRLLGDSLDMTHRRHHPPPARCLRLGPMRAPQRTPRSTPFVDLAGHAALSAAAADRSSNGTPRWLAVLPSRRHCFRVRRRPGTRGRR